MKRLITYLLFIVAFKLNAQTNLLPDTIGFCRGDSALLEIKPGTFPKTATYQWDTPYRIIYNTKQLYVKMEGKYTIIVRYSNKQFIDSSIIKIYSRPQINLNDTLICNHGSALVGFKNNNYKYLWSTDETSQKIRIENPGKYWVKVSNKGCSVTDTFNVNFFKGSTPNFGNEVTFCMSDENKQLSIKTAPGTKVLWSNGSTANSIVPYKAGKYWVKTDSKTCGSNIDSVEVKLKACDCEMLIPNSFTPNEDDKNDYFFPVLTCDYSYYNITIFDRWNNIVFSGSNVNAKWDGRYKGNLCPDDIYVYRIEAIEKNTDKKTVRSGQISLFR